MSPKRVSSVFNVLHMLSKTGGIAGLVTSTVGRSVYSELVHRVSPTILNKVQYLGQLILHD